MPDRLEIILELEKTARNAIRQMRKELLNVWGDNLTGGEFGVLFALSCKSPRMITGLSQEFDVSVSHITHVVDQLEQKELATRKRSQSDKRIVEVHITEKGTEMVAKFSQMKREHLLRQFEPFSTEEIQALLQLFQKLSS